MAIDRRGVQVIRGSDGLQPLQRQSQSVIGIVGTATTVPSGTYPVGEPYRVKGASEISDIDGTLGPALRHIFAQSRATVVAIRVAENSDRAMVRTSIWNAIPAFDMAQSRDGLVPRIYIVPDYTLDRPVSVSAIRVTSAGTGYDAASPPTVEISAPANGLQATATATVGSSGTVTGVTVTFSGVGYPEGSPPTVTISDPASGTTATATATLAATPNPIISRLLARVNAEGKGGIVISGVGDAATTTAQAMTFKADWGDRRLYLIHPWVKVADPSGASVNAESAPFVAGLFAKNDSDSGIHATPSRQVLNLATGLSVDLPFDPNNPLADINILNLGGVNTIVNYTGRRMIWGPRSTESNTSIWRYIMYVRQADRIVDALNRGYLQFIDEPLSADTVEAILDLGRTFLSEEEQIGAINNYIIEADSERNTETTMQNGEVHILMTFAPFIPLEKITVRLSISNNTQS